MVIIRICVKYTFRCLDEMAVCLCLILSFTTKQLTYKTQCICGRCHLLPNKPPWVNMEIHDHKQISLPATKLQFISYASVDFPMVKHSLRKSFSFKDPSLLSPVARNHFFLPSMQYGSFRSWSELLKG